MGPNSNMTGVLIKEGQLDTDAESRPCEEGENLDFSFDTSQEMPGAPGSWEKQGRIPPRAIGGRKALPTS